MLINNLLFSSKNYKTQKELTIKKQDLYGVSIGGGNYRKGNYIFTEIILSTILEKYTEKGLLEKAYEFLFDIIQNPNIIDNKFDSKSFDINYDMIKTQIKSEDENPSYYSLKKYKEILGKDKPFAYSIEGNLNDLNKISEENLFEYYNEFIKNNNIDIFITGNIDFDKMEKIIDKYFLFKQGENRNDDIYLSYEKPFSEDIIKSKFSQSRLVMGGSTKGLNDYEKKYTSMVYNIILGNSPNSKLFKNVI